MKLELRLSVFGHDLKKDSLIEKHEVLNFSVIVGSNSVSNNGSIYLISPPIFSLASLCRASRKGIERPTTCLTINIPFFDSAECSSSNIFFPGMKFPFYGHIN